MSEAPLYLGFLMSEVPLYLGRRRPWGQSRTRTRSLLYRTRSEAGPSRSCFPEAGPPAIRTSGTRSRTCRDGVVREIREAGPCRFRVSGTKHSRICRDALERLGMEVSEAGSLEPLMVKGAW